MINKINSSPYFGMQMDVYSLKKIPGIKNEVEAVNHFDMPDVHYDELQEMFDVLSHNNRGIQCITTYASNQIQKIAEHINNLTGMELPWNGNFEKIITNHKDFLYFGDDLSSLAEGEGVHVLMLRG